MERASQAVGTTVQTGINLDTQKKWLFAPCLMVEVGGKQPN